MPRFLSRFPRRKAAYHPTEDENLEVTRDYRTRLRVLYGILVLCLLIFAVVIYNAQIVNGADYDATSASRIAQQEPVEATRTIYIDLPLDADGILNLRVLMDGEEIYNQDVDASMQTSVPVTVTGSGVKFLTVYINGIESGVRTIDFSQPEAS